MSAPRSRPAIFRVRRSSTCASPAPPRSRTIASSTDRQYALAAKARELGWPADRIVVIDEDLGLSGSGFVARSGFARLTAEVALAHVGLVLGLEVSRLARNNADWHRLIELGGLTDTLIGDADGIYHPALFNDRLLLGLKGAMSEAELHVLRARLNGGIRNKAARGELRRGLPVGFVWGEAEGEVRFHPDEAVVAAIRNVFASFAQTGSARRVWLWFRSEGTHFPSADASGRADPLGRGQLHRHPPRSHASPPATPPRPTRQSARRSSRPPPARPHWRRPAHRRAEGRRRGRSCRRGCRSGKRAPPSPYNRAFSEGS